MAETPSANRRFRREVVMPEVGGRIRAWACKRTHTSLPCSSEYHACNPLIAEFADYWYACNGQFTDLKDHCAAIAKESGMPLAPDAAWRWIARGGFSNDVLGQPGLGGFDVSGVKGAMQLFSDRPMKWQVSQYNVFKLNEAGATTEEVPAYDRGEIHSVTCLRRGDQRLPLAGTFGLVVDTLRQTPHIGEIVRRLQAQYRAIMSPTHANVSLQKALQCLEVMLVEGWITGKLDKSKPRVNVTTPSLEDGRMIHEHDANEESDAMA